MERKARVERKTKETDIAVALNLDGKGESNISTGIGFFDHMLELFSRHSLIDLEVKAKGDLKVDEHHTVEDTAIALGEAINKALGEKKGITRFGNAIVPMDESLAMAAVDLGGRSYLVIDAEFGEAKLDDFRTELVEDFFKSFADNCKCNIHLKLFYGRNEHHKIEALFKAFAKAMKGACTMDENARGTLPSTKGKL
ncbi:MAG: imidazoleglycerol-phosphate dehydratase HisB [Candidatus Diapherotrites archaeon]